MKLKIFDRVTNIILILAIAAVAVVCVAFAWGFTPDWLFEGIGLFLKYDTLVKICVTVVGVLLLVLCARILFVRKRDNTGESQKSLGVLVKNGDVGSVYITISALDDMIQREVRKNSKVRDCKCDIAGGDRFVAVRLMVTLLSDAVVTETTAELQASVKERVESMTGIEVREVQCIVDKPTVEKSNLPERVL